MNIKNVVMDLPESDCKSLVSSVITTPLGAIILASQARSLGYESLAVNGEMIGQKETLSFLDTVVGDTTFLGLTCTAGNVLHTREITQRYSKLGAVVSIGGPNIGSWGKRFLLTWPEVDIAFGGFAERHFSEILRGEWSQCSGLSYRNRFGVYDNYSANDGTNLFDFTTPKIDYNCLYNLEQHHGATVVFSLICALWNDRCTFCARMSGGPGHRDPEVFWSEISNLFYDHGITFFYHAADSVPIGSKSSRAGRYLTELVKHQPKDLIGKITHRVFGNAFDMHEPSAALLSELGNIILHVGFESASLFKTVGKGKTSTMDNKRVLLLCSKFGIPLIASFVLGLDGESSKTLQETADYMIRLIEEHGTTDEGGIIKYMEASPLMILPHSKDGNNLWEKIGLPTEGPLNPLQLDFLTAGKKHLELHCQVSREEIISVLGKVSEKLRGVLDVKGISREEGNILNLRSDYRKILNV